MLVTTGIALVLFAASATEGEEYTNSIGMRMIRVEPGTFLMGSLNPTPPGKLQGPKHLPNGDWDEKPVHNVIISKPFYISETEITIEQWQEKSRIVLARSQMRRHCSAMGQVWRSDQQVQIR